MTHSKYRGHTIEFTNSTWIYSDNKQPVSSEPNRSCGNCGRGQTEHGHDGCIGTLTGVMNACCGHGSDDEAYIQYENGKELRGGEALSEMKKQNEVKIERVSLERILDESEFKNKYKNVRIYSGEWGMYWRSKSGYTNNKDEAQIFTIEEALNLSSHCGPEKKIKYELAPCPDCTAPQPTDEEIDYGNEFNKAIEDYTCDQILEYFFFHRGYKAQSAKLKEQADDIDRLKDEKNTLISKELYEATEEITTLLEENRTLSSLLDNAGKILKRCKVFIHQSYTMGNGFENEIEALIKKLQERKI